MIAIKNLNPYLKKLRADREKLKTTPQKYVRAAVLKAFKIVLRESPQYSGDFAANWNIETRATGSTPYFEIGRKGELEDKILKLGPKDEEYKSMLRYAGHPEAIAEALQRAQTVLPTIKWNSKIFFTNRTPIAGAIGTPGKATPDGTSLNYRPVHQHLQNVAFVAHLKTVIGLKGLV